MIRIFLVRGDEPFGRARERMPDLVARSSQELTTTASSLTTRERDAVHLAVAQVSDAAAVDVIVANNGAIYRTVRVDSTNGVPTSAGLASVPAPSWRTRYPGAHVVMLGTQRLAIERVEHVLNFLGYHARTETAASTETLQGMAERTARADVVLLDEDVLTRHGNALVRPIQQAGRAVVHYHRAPSSPVAGTHAVLDATKPVATWASVLDSAYAARGT